MRYSLRTLLIVTTIVAVAAFLAGRMSAPYLQKENERRLVKEVAELKTTNEENENLLRRMAETILKLRAADEGDKKATPGARDAQ